MTIQFGKAQLLTDFKLERNKPLKELVLKAIEDPEVQALASELGDDVELTWHDEFRYTATNNTVMAIRIASKQKIGYTNIEQHGFWDTVIKPADKNLQNAVRFLKRSLKAAKTYEAVR